MQQKLVSFLLMIIKLLQPKILGVVKKKWCHFYDADIYEDTLISQFRCNGSDSYLSWIDNVFEINTEATDDFEMSWNLRLSSTWAIDPDSVDEIGCIHTCQGLEVDSMLALLLVMIFVMKMV